MAAESNFKKERIKTPLDNNKLNLKAPTPGHPGKFASLIWGFVNNNPRISVYTNDPDDTGERNGYGRIGANLDLVMFTIFLNHLHEACDAKEEYKKHVENKAFTFPGGKRSEAPKVVSKLWVGKDKDGIVYISVTAENRPKIKFAFTLPDFHTLHHEDGTPYTASEISVLVAKAYVLLLGRMVTTMAVSLYQEPPPKQPPANNGGYQRNNQQPPRSGGGGYSTPDDDDIPF